MFTDWMIEATQRMLRAELRAVRAEIERDRLQARVSSLEHDLVAAQATLAYTRRDNVWAQRMEEETVARRDSIVRHDGSVPPIVTTVTTPRGTGWISAGLAERDTMGLVDKLEAAHARPTAPVHHDQGDGCIPEGWRGGMLGG